MKNEDPAFTKERGTHNHVTRDIKAVGQCPACDDYWGITYNPAHRTATYTPPAAADTGTPVRPRRTVTDGTADSVAIHRPAQQEFNAHRTAAHDDEGTGR